MFSIPFIDKLYYNYDAAILDPDKEYSINSIYFQINDDLIRPFIELMLNKNGGFVYAYQDLIRITPRNLKMFISRGINNGRYQGYHVDANIIYLYFRANTNCPIAIISTIMDIVDNKKQGNLSLSRDVINYFSKIQTQLYIYDNRMKKTIKELPKIIYSYVRPNDIEYVRTNKSMYS